METSNRKNLHHPAKIKGLIYIAIFFLLAGCQKEVELYETRDNTSNTAGPLAFDVTGKFNVYQITVNSQEVTDLGIEEITYDRDNQMLISRKILGNSGLYSGEIQWECAYFGEDNIGTYNQFQTNATFKRTMNVRIINKNWIVINFPNGFPGPLTLIRRIVQSE